MLDPNSSITKKGSIETSPRSYQTLFAFVWAGILGVCMCFVTAAAYAQQDAVSSGPVLDARASGGWWSPGRNESMLVIPGLNIRMVKLVRLETAGRSLSPTPTRPIYHITEYANRWNASHSGFEFSDTHNPEFSVLAEAQLARSGPFFSLLNAKYLAWEIALSDSRSLTNVNGMLVYPLIEVDYAHRHLPVAMYISPLRGNPPR